MGEENKETTQKSKSFVEHAEFVLKILGAGTLLIAIMGWPAVSLNYHSYGIPSNLIATEAAVRAGIQPALIFMLIFGYFWYVLNACQRLLPMSHDARSTPLFLFHVVPLAALAILIRVIGASSGIFILLWWLLGHLGFVFETKGTLFWVLTGISIPLGVGLILLMLATIHVIVNHFNRRDFNLEEDFRPHWTISLYVYLIEYIEFSKNFIALYFIYFFIKIAFPEFSHLFSLPSILVASSFLALAAMMVGVGVAVLKGHLDLALGNLRQSSGFVGITALMTVWMYSTDIHPNLPKSWGGGKPDSAELWIEKSKAPPFDEWQRIKVIEPHYRLRPGYLLHLDDKNAIITERSEPPAKWVVVPRATIATISSL